MLIGWGAALLLCGPRGRRTTWLISLLPSPTPSASATSPAGWTRLREPTAPQSVPRLSLPVARGRLDRGQVALAAVAQYKDAVAAGASKDVAAGLLAQGAYSAQHLRTLEATAVHYEVALRGQSEDPWPLTAGKVTQWLVLKFEAVLAAGETRAADHYSGALSDLLAAARLRDQPALPESERGRLSQVCVALSNATPLTARRQATHLTDVALEVMEQVTPRLPWARQVLTMARVMMSGNLRSGPVVGLLWEHVTEGLDAGGRPTLELRFPWEKTEREHLATLRPDPDARVCGYTALRAWRASAPHGVGDGAGAGGASAAARGVVFPHLDPRTHAADWTRSMSQAQFSSRMQMLAREAGLPNPERYTGHVGRSGGATRALLQGAATEEVMHAGRWRSRPSFNRYDRREQDAAVRAAIEPLRRPPSPVRGRVDARDGHDLGPGAAAPPRPLGVPHPGALFEPGPATPARTGPAAGPVRALDLSDDGEASEESGRSSHGDGGPDSGSSASGAEDAISLEGDEAAAAARRASERWYELNGVPAEWRGRAWIGTPLPGQRGRRRVRMVKEARAEALAAKVALSKSSHPQKRPRQR